MDVVRFAPQERRCEHDTKQHFNSDLTKQQPTSCPVRQSRPAAAVAGLCRGGTGQARVDDGCYVSYAAQGDLPEATWPDVTLQELLRLAFGQRFIADATCGQRG